MGFRAIRSATLVLLAAATLARAEVRCSESTGAPGSETTATLRILSPDPGATITTPGCGRDVDVFGRWTITGPAVDHDFYIVIDRSGSTSDFSGADVNGNGILREPADNILRAEIAAARAFVEAVPPDHGRVAIVTFNGTAVLQQQLGTVGQALATLDAMATLGPSGGTAYAPALALVEAEINLRGSPATRRQRCLFLSDGRPGDSLSADAAARRLAAMGVVIDSFALGFSSSSSLESMAAVSGGTFTPLSTPGEIVTVLPWFVPVTPSSFVAVHVEASSTVPIEVRDDGTFAIRVRLVPGANSIRLTLNVGDPPTLSVTCGVEVSLQQTLTADAGPDLTGCLGRPITLSGVRSLVPCASPRYRWLDCRGVPVSPTSSSPEWTVRCGECDRYVLETWCQGEGCPRSDEVLVACTRVPPPAPIQVRACELDAFVSCGAPEAGFEEGWDLDPLVDADGNGDASDDADLLGCDQSIALAAPGAAAVAAWRRDAAACSVALPLTVAVGTEPPRPLSGGACPGEPVRLQCAGEEPGGRTEWDLDAGTDSDGDGDPGNDADAVGCVVVTSLADGAHDVRGWAIDAFGCRRLAASGTLLVAGGVPPGEAWDLHLARRGADVEMRWAPVVAADRYRIARGTLRSLAVDRAYDHLVDESVGAGTCGATTSPWLDLGEASDPGSFYYLVTAFSDCGGEGPAGSAWTPWIEPRRPPRLPTASCP